MQRVASWTKSDFETMWRTIFGEARGESALGQLAVAFVIVNRVATDIGKDGKPDWWGEGIAEVCLKPRQFACWTVGDPNREALLAADASQPAALKAMHAAITALLGLAADPTGGATHYHGPGVSPPWTIGRRPTAGIGRHVFYVA